MNTEDVIIVPYHEKKIDFIQSDISTSILVDDYSVNLKEWYPVKFRKVSIIRLTFELAGLFRIKLFIILLK